MATRERSVVPSTSEISDSDRKPLVPEVESLLGGQEYGPESQTSEVSDSETPGLPESQSSGDPKWTTLERKEARLRADQLTDLAELRRHVSSRRRDRGEIITDNTLIRVAVDLLLRGHAHRLHGDTEEDLLRSVLPRRRSNVLQEEGSSEMAERT